MKQKLILLMSGLIATMGCTHPENRLVVGATPVPHAEILEQAKPLLKAKGIALEIKIFSDYVTPNLSLADRSLDANFFQHLPYLESFESSRHFGIVSAGTVHYEPLGVYSLKIRSLQELKDGDRIAVPMDVSNEGRALALLADNGILTLKDSATLTATKHDIASYIIKVEIVELDAAQIPRALSDVNAAVINGNYAIEAKLNPAVDALATERNDSLAARTYANIVAVRKADVNRLQIKELVSVLQSSEIRTFIEKRYKGAVIPVK